MSTVRLLAVFVENKPGQSARITKLLAEARINIRWVTIASSGPFGVMKFLVTDLAAGTWQVWRDGKIVRPAASVVESEGTLYFEGPAGSYQLRR